VLVSLLIGVPLGIAAALNRGKLIDGFCMVFATIGISAPVFVISVLLMYLFCGVFPVFPNFGLNSWQSYVLPVACLAFNPIAYIARQTRSSMLDAMGQDYIRTARAKGLSRSKVYYKHALKNTMAVVGTVIANSIAALLGGAAVTEKVFNIRGMGTLAVDSLGRRDYSQEQAIVLFFAMVTLVVNLLMDIFYKLMDPRIQYE